jgi:hypothetical protein
MIDIESVQLTVGRQVDTGLPLNVEHDTRGVDERLFTRQRRQPVGYRIRPDGCRQNSGRGFIGAGSHSVSIARSVQMCVIAASRPEGAHGVEALL